MFQNPLPFYNDLTKHYPLDEYYAYSLGKKSGWAVKFYKNTYTKGFFSKILFYPFRFFFRSIKFVKNGKILDIGCGAGNFLLVMNELGMNCYGVEPAMSPAVSNDKLIKENKIKIKQCTLEQARYPTNYFDVVIMHHVFEHVSTPQATLAEIHKILKQGGIAVITVPQSDCWLYYIFKENWTQLDVPRHSFIYSTSNLKEYAKKNGFKVDRIRYNSLPFAWVYSMFYWIYRNDRKKLYSPNTFINVKPLRWMLIALAIPVTILANLFRKGDQAEITLKKI